MSLRDCLKLQTIPLWGLVDLTLFGRALLKGQDRWGADDVMLYWLKLPFFGMYYEAYRDRHVWGQRVLFFHGRDGFSVRWTPVSGDGKP